MLTDLSAIIKSIRAFILGEKDPSGLLADEIYSLREIAERFNFLLDPSGAAFKPPLGLTIQEFHDELVLLHSAVQATPSASKFDKTSIEVFFGHLVLARAILIKCGMQVAIHTGVLVERISVPTSWDSHELNLAAPDWSQGVISPAAAGISSVSREPRNTEAHRVKARSYAPIDYPKFASYVVSDERTRDECHQEYVTENIGLKTYGRSSFIAKLSAWMRDNTVGDPKGQSP
ncbi:MULTISPECIES: hypothetical protein [Polaromonas]|uniref:Uncharacterized protein n=1 Tax=Polaromonas aquatica TaxID=332657 RepID=A0ABW1U5Y9_9BURK